MEKLVSSLLLLLALALAGCSERTRELYIERDTGHIIEVTFRDGKAVAAKLHRPWGGEAGAGGMTFEIEQGHVLQFYRARSTASVMRFSARGDWDRVASELYFPRWESDAPDSLRETIRTYLDSEELEAPSSWLRLPDPRAVELVAQFEDQNPRQHALLDELLNDFPNDRTLWLLALDDAALSKDLELLRTRLDMWEDELAREENSTLRSAAAYYSLMFISDEQTREGRNLMVKLGALRFDKELPPMEDAKRLVLHASYEDVYLADSFPLVLPREFRTMSFQYFYLPRCLGVEGDFHLLRGEVELALDLYFGLHRTNTSMTGSSAYLIDRLIGIGRVSRTVGGLELAFLNGFLRGEALEQHWPRLEEAYHAYVQATLRPPYLRMPDELSYIESDKRPEYRTRAQHSRARMALVLSGAAVRHELLAGGDYPAEGADRFTTILPAIAPDPFSADAAPLRFRRDDAKDFVLYSIGPDRTDGRGLIEYDPTNGTLSAGDIRLFVPREREYPFPVDRELPQTQSEILLMFPWGLPPDPFADTRLSSYVVTADDPAIILSFGPDGDEAKYRGGEATEVQSLLPFPPAPVGTYLGGYRWFDPDITKQPPYDPTNGAISAGNIYLRR